jgi:neutral ceramidase
MFRFRSIAAPLCFCLCLMTFRLPASAAVGPLKAGAAVADITPQTWPIPMVGNFDLRGAERAWDPLSACALVLDNGDTRLAFVIVDSCYCPRELFDEAKRRASELCSIRTDHILSAATHTHSAPASRDRRDLKADPQYVEHITRGIVSALHQATFNLAPAEIGFGTCQVPEEVHNRRWFMNAGGIVPNPFGETTDQVRMNPPRDKKLLDRPAGPVDPTVSFFSVRTTAGRPIALLASYGLHYVGGVPAGGVSADYFGEFARQITQRVMPGDERDTLPPFVGIMANGTSGDVNNINFTNPQPRSAPFVRIREVASRVADRVAEALPNVKYQSTITLAAAQSELTLKVRKPTDAQVTRAAQFLAEDDESKLPRLAKPYATWTLKLAEHAGTEDIVLQAFRIGDVGITAIPCEVFTEIGLSLKDRSPLKPSFNIELANGHYGYLPTPRQHDLGGYETWLGTCILEEEASVKIEDRLLELLDQVAKEN